MLIFFSILYFANFFIFSISGGFAPGVVTSAARRAGGRIVELPISFSDRQHGTSKMSGRIVVEAMLLVTWWGVRDRLRRRR